jgi:hypothetical protein
VVFGRHSTTPWPHNVAALDEEAADLVDHTRTLADEARAHAMQSTGSTAPSPKCIVAASENKHPSRHHGLLRWSPPLAKSKIPSVSYPARVRCENN